MYKILKEVSKIPEERPVDKGRRGKKRGGKGEALGNEMDQTALRACASVTQ